MSGENINMHKVSLPFVLLITIAAFLLSFTVQFTAPYIAINQKKATSNAIYSVFPNAKNFTEFVVNGNALDRSSDQNAKNQKRVYALYDANGGLTGIALKAKGPAYAQELEVIYAYDSVKECITGFKVLKSNETPNIGSKITTDANFKKNFDCLSVRLNPEKTGLQNEIKTVPHGKKTAEYEVDAIAGATVTSNGVGNMLNKSAEEMIPIIVKNIDIIKSGNK